MADLAIESLKMKLPPTYVDIHMNDAYFFTDLSKICSIGGAPSSIYIESIKYKKDTDFLTEENILEVKRYSYTPQLLPQDSLYHFILPIENYFYKFRLTPVYSGTPDEKGLQLFFGETKDLIVDNTFPMLSEKRFSKFYINEFRNNLEKRNSLNIFYGDVLIDEAKIGDIKGIIGTRIFKKILAVIETGGIPEIIYGSADNDTLRAISFILNDDNFVPTLETYFENSIPEDGTIIFRFMINKEPREIKIQGNLKEIASVFKKV